jgi:hypothetical protein
MSSSKLQSCLELCRFIQSFFKPGLKNRKRVPFGLAMVFHSWLSSEHDSVLLEIRNQNEGNCLWSLVATTSLNLVIISLSRCQSFLNTNLTMFVSSSFVMTLDDWCVHYSDQVHSLLSWFSLFLVLVVSQGNSDALSILFAKLWSSKLTSHRGLFPSARSSQ